MEPLELAAFGKVADSAAMWAWLAGQPTSTQDVVELVGGQELVRVPSLYGGIYESAEPPVVFAEGMLPYGPYDYTVWVAGVIVNGQRLVEVNLGDSLAGAGDSSYFALKPLQ